MAGGQVYQSSPEHKAQGCRNLLCDSSDLPLEALMGPKPPYIYITGSPVELEVTNTL